MRATQAMGRGFDMAWFDSTIYKEFQTVSAPKAFMEKVAKDGYSINTEKYIQSKIMEYEKNFSNKYRIGVTYFPAIAVGDKLAKQPLLDTLIHHFCLTGGVVNGLMISTLQRFLKRDLPQTDFAYFWDEGGKNKILCCNKKVKELLVSQRMLKERDMRPLAIYDILPVGCVDLKNDTEYPPPIYTDEEFQELKKEEKKRREKFNKKAMPRRMPNIKNILKLLRHVKKEQGDSSIKGISKKSVDAFLKNMTILLPEYWVDILKISNGGEYGIENGFDCMFVPLKEIDLFHINEVNNRIQIDENYKEVYTYFSSTITGDSYAFIKSPYIEAKDAKVVLISHEDFSIEREWENIAYFLESILLGL